MTALASQALIAMRFPERPAALRKERGRTQQAPADRVGLAIRPIRHDQGGSSQPDRVRRLAVAHGLNADVPFFDDQERSPAGTLRDPFEAVSRMSEHDQESIRELLDAATLKNPAAGTIERVARQAPAKSMRRGADGTHRTAHPE